MKLKKRLLRIKLFKFKQQLFIKLSQHSKPQFPTDKRLTKNFINASALWTIAWLIALFSAIGQTENFIK